MKIFELHFNPKANKNIILDSFIYEPENIEEKKLGSLYLVGKLFNPLPQHSRFLNNLSSVIKKEYFKISSQSSEQALKRGLKYANEFLSNISEQGDVSWLSNLDFAILSLKNFIFNFTKVGDIKILIIREGETIDVSQNLEFQDIEPYPLKVFNNIVSGKLVHYDKILILTKEIYEYFSKQKLFNNFNKLSIIKEKDLKAIIKPHKKNLLKISGVCLLFSLEPMQFPKTKFKTIEFQNKKSSCSFLFLSILKPVSSFMGIASRLKKSFAVFVKNCLTKKLFFFLKTLLSNFFYNIAQKFSWLKIFKIRKNILLIITLISMLIIGHLIFG